MHSVSAGGGLGQTHKMAMQNHQPGPPDHAKQPGPPDHAKAWGWRAQQPQEPTTGDTTPVTDPPVVDPMAPTGISAMLSGAFGEISINIASVNGEFEIEVEMEDGELSVEIETNGPGGEIDIEFVMSAHGGIKVTFEQDDAGEITLNAANVVAEDPPITVETTPMAPAAPVVEPSTDADMESLIVGLISGETATSDVNASAEYNEVQALFGQG